MELYTYAVRIDLELVRRATRLVQEAAAANAQCRKKRRALESLRAQAVKTEPLRIAILRAERTHSRLEALAVEHLATDRVRSALRVLGDDVERDLDAAIVADAIDSAAAGEVLDLLRRAEAELERRRDAALYDFRTAA